MVPRLELVIDGRELLVDGHQLLLRGFKLLVHALKLLVARNELFVCQDPGSSFVRPCSSITVWRYSFVAASSCSSLGLREFFDTVSKTALRLRPPSFLEQDDVEGLLGVARPRERNHEHVAHERDAVVIDFHSRDPRRDGSSLCFRQCRAQRHREAAARHRHHIVLRSSRRGPQVGPRLALDLQDLHPLVHNDSRRRMASREQSKSGRHDGPTQPIPVVARRIVRARRRRIGPARLGPSRKVKRAGHRGPREDLGSSVDRVEELLEPGDALRSAEEQEARLTQGIVERGDDPLLERGVEVDENVAAADEIDMRERGVAREVVLDEYTLVANGLDDSIASSPFTK